MLSPKIYIYTEFEVDIFRLITWWPPASNRRDTSSRPTDLYRNALFFFYLFIFEWLVQQEPTAKPLKRKWLFLLHTRHPFAKSFLSHLFISPTLVEFYFFLTLAFLYFRLIFLTHPLHPFMKTLKACYVFFVSSFSNSLSAKSVFHQISPTIFSHNVYRDFFSLFIL